MERIYQDACDKNVAAVVVYLNSEDSKLYYDADFTAEMEVPAEDLKNLFVKGVLCDDGTNLLAAQSYSEEGGIVFASVQ
jgi:hypothetical protein